MLRNLTFAAAVAFAVAMPHGRADEQKAPGDKNEQGIKAEVRGTLRFESLETGRGYFISVKSADKPERESRVWLRIGEDKALVRQLQGLTGKEVMAKGNLEQMPANVGASVPPLGIYLIGFEIDHAGAK